MSATIKHLVFDMGGVLVQIDWHNQVSKILGEDIPFEQIHARWANSKAATDFEEGNISFDEFAQQLIAENNLNTSEAEVKAAFRAILLDDFPGIVELLQQLKPNYTLSLLSNTNSFHWEILNQRNSFIPLLDNPFTSMDFGVMKPDPEIYRKLVSALNCEPQEILFFDDGVKNVTAARELGLNAEQVFGPDDIKAVLPKYGVQLG
ncbi:HAD family hydrolase [Reinekea marinisedimentorum]|uniref:Putative hydrolase of the HAD superfamily n=1 Tax=Reinekea marinisedimentorum TaxID=230495 RepID=A0A4R3IDG0_9GAMM|nr:HAD family phosphatase [Reinekea marinisedimentorum]TCS43806.1 putative hydrolase of the HAD superfamily [Reinekea marinisedimentorum]